MAHTPQFEEIKQAVYGDILRATNAHGLLTRLIFPLCKQERLLRHYHLVIEGLHDALIVDVVLTVCRLFDPVADYRHATLVNCLRGVQGLASEIPPERQQAARSECYQNTRAMGEEIRARWKTNLVVYRSAELAHRDLTKVLPRDVSLADIRECIELAQDIWRRYILAFEDAGMKGFEFIVMESQPGQFLEWCRLDDYERHFTKATEAEMAERLRRFWKGQAREDGPQEAP